MLSLVGFIDSISTLSTVGSCFIHSVCIVCCCFKTSTPLVVSCVIQCMYCVLLFHTLHTFGCVMCYSVYVLCAVVSQSPYVWLFHVSFTISVDCCRCEEFCM